MLMLSAFNDDIDRLSLNEVRRRFPFNACWEYEEPSAPTIITHHAFDLLRFLMPTLYAIYSPHFTLVTSRNAK